MMKKSNLLITLGATLFALSAMTGQAMARDNYFSWKIGTSQMEIDNITGLGLNSAYTVNSTSEDDDVTSFSLAYGRKFSESPLPMRMEIELTVRSSFDYSTNDLYVGTPSTDTIHSDINSHTLFANLYLDLLPQKSPIVPYVGGGVGIAWNVWDNNDWYWWDDSETTSGFAWNVGGGVALKLSRRLMLDVTYRYIDFGEAELTDLLKINDLTTNEVQLGLRLNF